ncbi:hypothetical protein FA13DRAFT_1819314 [Coprinellus micaceus]|uniref:Protein-S-isoprenylcysteine O-methyltransferase n=1 Tax=Coprinellus micaceus TaxID=71717 RepID=A0A4Y7SJ61_COPMI|nr:hypothetical protein FA13DRAFT_1819314 [Coprinellus micaceus]
MNDIVKIPFLLLFLALARRNLSPPAARALKEEKAPSTRLEFILDRNFAKIMKTVYSALAVVEILTIVYHSVPSSQTALLPGLHVQVEGRLHLTPAYCLCLALALLGTLIRVSAFSRLGHMFTYEMSVLKDHKLITNGPYAWVRHPAYTGVFLFFISAGCCITAEGSWLRESGILGSTVGQVATASFFAFQLTVTTALCTRIQKEDEAMQKSFGEEWERWARVVKWKLVPGLI